MVLTQTNKNIIIGVCVVIGLVIIGTVIFFAMKGKSDSDSKPDPKPPTPGPSPGPSPGPDCKLKCQNGGTLDDTACSCACVGKWGGDQCDSCQMKCDAGKNFNAECTACDGGPSPGPGPVGNCPNNCSEKGTCNADGTCTCNFLRFGKDCSEGPTIENIKEYIMSLVGEKCPKLTKFQIAIILANLVVDKDYKAAIAKVKELCGVAPNSMMMSGVNYTGGGHRRRFVDSNCGYYN